MVLGKALRGSSFANGVLAFLQQQGIVAKQQIGRAQPFSELRAELFARMQKLPISYFDANTNGSLMSYYTNDIEATNELLQHSITQLAISITSLVGTVAMMLALSMRLFAIMVVLGAIVVLVVRVTTKISKRTYASQQRRRRQRLYGGDDHRPA